MSNKYQGNRDTFVITEQGNYVIERPSVWWVHTPCHLEFSKAYNDNDVQLDAVIINVLSDNVSIGGIWEKLNITEINYGNYRPPELRTEVQ